MIEARRRWTLLLLAALTMPSLGSGCSPNSTVCQDGSICPPSSRCDTDRHRCITTLQELPCNGLAQGDGCTFANAVGACRAGVCEPFFCGDGFVTQGESCDGAPPPGKSCLDYGFDRGLLGCSAVCELAFEGCSSSHSWTNWSIPSTGALNGVWASSTDDVYVVGNGILHWDGIKWSTAMPDFTFNEVWGSGPDDVFAVGPGVVHWNGSQWSTILPGQGNPGSAGGGAGPAGPPGSASPIFYGVWGSGPGDVFVVGAVGSNGAAGDGVLMHWNGSRWDRVVDPTFAALSILTTVWGTGPGDVFVAGAVPDAVPNLDGYPTYHHVILHRSGSTWSNVFDTVDSPISGLGGSGPGDVFAVGALGDTGFSMHWDGTSWSSVAPASEPLGAVWAGGRDEVYAVGTLGTVFKWDGGNWVVSRSVDAGTATFDGTRGIFGTAGSIFALAAGPTGLRRERSRWSSVASLSSHAGVWASGPDDAYTIGMAAPGSAGFSHWDGTQWAPTGPAIPSLRSVWGSGPGDVFAVGDQGIVAHWDGRVWSQSAAGPEFEQGGASGGRGGTGGKAGSGAGAGAGGLAGSGAGGTAGTGTAGARGDLVSVWGSSPGDVFAVSTDRQRSSGQWALLHGNGASWSTLVSPDPFVPSGVWGSGPDDVFVVGFGMGLNDASIYHWNGAVLSPMNVPNPADVYVNSVWGSGPNDVFAVGASSILHWDGAQWGDARPDKQQWGDPGSGKPQLIYAMTVGGSGPGDVFVGGYGGVLLHRRGGIWEPVRLRGLSSTTGLSVTPGRVFAVGDSGEVHLDRPSVTCMAPERDCNDGWDNDCDDRPDGADPDCAGKVVEQCANLADDDGDGKADCADPDCAEFPFCKNAPFVGGAARRTVGMGTWGSSEGAAGTDGAGPSSGGAGGMGGAAGAPTLMGIAGVGGAPPPPGGAGTSGTGSSELTPNNLISDFENDAAATVVMTGNPPRHGDWYTYNDDAPTGTDPFCVQTPPAAQQSPTGQWVPYPVEAPPGGVRQGSTGRLALHGSWQGCIVWGAGIGAMLNVPVDPAGGTYSGPQIPYDVTPFSGVTFWAMAAAGTSTALRIKFPMTDDVGVDNGGLCVESPTGKCYDDYGESFSFPADGTWRQITVRWSDPGFRQEGWGTRFPWTPSHVTSIQIQSSQLGGTYDFWIDDLYFIN